MVDANGDLHRLGEPLRSDGEQLPVRWIAVAFVVPGDLDERVAVLCSSRRGDQPFEEGEHRRRVGLQRRLRREWSGLSWLAGGFGGVQRRDDVIEDRLPIAIWRRPQVQTIIRVRVWRDPTDDVAAGEIDSALVAIDAAVLELLRHVVERERREGSGRRMIGPVVIAGFFCRLAFTIGRRRYIFNAIEAAAQAALI